MSLCALSGHINLQTLETSAAVLRNLDGQHFTNSTDDVRYKMMNNDAHYRNLLHIFTWTPGKAKKELPVTWAGRWILLFTLFTQNNYITDRK